MFPQTSWFPVSVFCLNVQYQRAGPLAVFCFCLFPVQWSIIFLTEATSVRKKIKGAELRYLRGGWVRFIFGVFG
jgi:hypothetical protein